MSTCDTQALMDASGCFNCLSSYQLQLVQTALLCQISGMTCDAQTLMDDAKCFACLTAGQLMVIQTQLLCNISQAGGVGAGASFAALDSPSGGSIGFTASAPRSEPMAVGILQPQMIAPKPRIGFFAGLKTAVMSFFA